ncbi:alpha/beta fold hydrolase [Mycobacterium vicinigordonae]|uniref:Alpha/beta hydrolase n=1 Tax=Mycobacterium vicinigordonae TaxID=1719132 RepID=A0A7D6HZ93_9MYCO|nr:alpha/beta hydrolase [Mycobacterium vicinigordonae]QLL08495.1 alpha/beta hydrolase [Mycobacterium vicinigordonae]
MLPQRIRSDEADLVTLPDGRVLACLDWGEPAGYPAFYFHGTPSCRLEAVFADAAARRHGFRLIAVDRPGFGRSTFQRGRRFRDWPADVCALADALDLTTFGVLGHSGAGPHLFACGAFIPHSRLTFIGALGPWGPLVTPEIMHGLSGADRLYARLARFGPGAFHAAYVPFGWGARYAPGFFAKVVTVSLPDTDLQHVRDELFLRHFRAIQLEAFRQGGRGGAHETFLEYRPWGFGVDEVSVPTHIWQGDRDTFIPRVIGEYLQRVVPDVDLNWARGKGHFNIEDWDAVLAACAADVGLG